MREQEWRDRIQRLVETYVSEYRKEHGLPDIWRTPLVGYADALKRVRRIWRSMAWMCAANV